MALNSASRSVGALLFFSVTNQRRYRRCYYNSNYFTSKLTVFSFVTGLGSRLGTTSYYYRYTLIAFSTLLCVAAAVVYHCLSTERSTYTERSGTIQVTQHNVVFKLGRLRFIMAEHYRRRDVPGAHGTGGSRARTGEAPQLQGEG